LEQTRRVGVAKSERPRLTIGEIISEEFQPMWSQFTNVIHGQTDRRHAIAIPRFALKCIARYKAYLSESPRSKCRSDYNAQCSTWSRQAHTDHRLGSDVIYDSDIHIIVVHEHNSSEM